MPHLQKPSSAHPGIESEGIPYPPRPADQLIIPVESDNATELCGRVPGLTEMRQILVNLNVELVGLTSSGGFLGKIGVGTDGINGVVQIAVNHLFG
jgi:hypothetical protein